MSSGISQMEAFSSKVPTQIRPSDFQSGFGMNYKVHVLVDVRLEL